MQHYYESIRLTFYFDPPTYDQLYNLPVSSEPIPDAGHWFFIRFTARTGSTVFAELLSQHPDVHCSNESEFIGTIWPILRAKRFVYSGANLEQSFISHHGDRISWNLAKFRTVMEALRQVSTTKPFYGDKTGLLRFTQPLLTRYNALYVRAFPSAKYFLMVRSPLDQVSSWINQRWSPHIEGREKRIADIHSKIKAIYQNNVYAKPYTNLIIEFERFFEKTNMINYLQESFKIIGADPTKYDYEQAWQSCRHLDSYQRWKKDTDISEYLAWLKERKYFELHDFLLQEEYFLSEALMKKTWPTK